MDTPNDTTKRCPHCKTLKPFSEFYKDKSRKDGLYSHCKACSILSVAKWRNNNKDKARQYEKDWHKRNPDQVKAIDHKWYAANPEKARAKRQRRRARLQSLLSGFTPDHWRYAITYFHGGCAYCGNPPSMFDRFKVLHQDHYIPITMGGGYTHDNIVPACQGCNFNKRDKPPAEWLIGRFGKRKAAIIQASIHAFFENTRRTFSDV